MEDDLRVSFLLDFDTEAANENLKKFEDNMDGLVKHAMKEGHELENVFKSLGVAVDASLNDRLDALRQAAASAEAEVRNARADVEMFRSQAESNLSKGYTGEWEDAVKDMADAEKRAAAATQKLATYKKALLSLSEAAGETVTKGASANMVFISEEDYNRAKELAKELERIKDLRAQAANEDDLQGDEQTKVLAAYDTQIIETQKELDTLNEKARATAEGLGDSLGGRVEAATTNLYELNSAVKEQQGVYDELKGKLDEVSENLEAAMDFDKDKVPELQRQYKELAEQVENAGNKLADLKGKQKDAEDELKSFAGILGEAGKDTEKLDSSFSRATTSVTSIARAFSASKNPITIFRASLNALRGGMKLIELGAGGIKSALLSLWKVMLANPFTAVAVGLAAVTAGIIALVNSTKNATEKLIELYSAQKAHADAMKKAADQRFASQEDVISGLENELAIMKAQHKSIAEIRAKEDELNEKRKEYAKENQYNYAGYTKNVEEYRKGIAEAEKEIGRLKEIQIREDNEDETVKYKINGEELEGDADKAIEALQAYIDTRTIWITLGTKGREDEKKANLEKAQLDRERLEQNREIADAETSAKRAAVNAEISLINDAYAREVAAAKQASKEKIEDLKKRLAREENLTLSARKAINDNILSEEKLLEQKLAKIEYDHEKQILDIRRQIEDTMAPVGELTQDQQLAALSQTYDRLMQDVQDKIKNKDILGLTPNQVAEYEKLYSAYLDRKSREEALFAKKREVAEIETEKATLDLRLAAVKQNSEEEYRLRADMIEKERQAEIAANKLLAEDQQMDEGLINDKYYRQQEDLYKEFLANMDADYRQWLGNIDALTVVELERLLEESKKVLYELMKRKLAGDITVDDGEIKRLMAQIEELEVRIKDANLTPKQKDLEYWRKISTYVSDLGNSFQDLGDAIGGATGEMVNFVGQAMLTISNTIDAVTTGIEKAAATTVTALKAVETASVILTVISAAITLVKGLVSLFDDSDEKAEAAARATKHYQNAVAALKREYDALAYAIDKVYGTDKQALIKKQIDLQERQVQLARERYQEYQDMYDKTMRYSEENGIPISFDEDFLGELEARHSAYEEEMRTLKDLKDAAIDAIFGSDIQSAIERFADAITNAWDQGMDAAQTARDFINGLVQDMLKQAILSALENGGMMSNLRNMLTAWVQSLNLGMQSVPRLVLREVSRVGEDVITDGIGRLAAPTLDEIYQWGEQWAEALSNSNFADWWRTMTEQIEGDRAGSARGIAQASQESVDELNGRMTAVQGHTFQISENSNIIRDNVSAILGSVQRIEANTEELHQMRNDIHSIKTMVDNADTQGVRIRS